MPRPSLDPPASLEELIEYLKAVRLQVGQYKSAIALGKRLEIIRQTIEQTEIASDHPAVQECIHSLVEFLKDTEIELSWMNISSQKAPLPLSSISQSITHTCDILQSASRQHPFPSEILIPLISSTHACQWASQLDPESTESAKAMGLYLLHQNGYQVDAPTLLEFHRVICRITQHDTPMPTALSIINTTCEIAMQAENQATHRSPEFYTELKNLAEALLNLE